MLSYVSVFQVGVGPLVWSCAASNYRQDEERTGILVASFCFSIHKQLLYLVLPLQLRLAKIFRTEFTESGVNLSSDWHTQLTTSALQHSLFSLRAFVTSNILVPKLWHSCDNDPLFTCKEKQRCCSYLHFAIVSITKVKGMSQSTRVTIIAILCVLSVVSPR